MTFPTSKPCSNYWVAANTTARDAIGSNDGARVGDFCDLLSDGSRYICTGVTGGDTSTWAAVGGGAAGLWQSSAGITRLITPEPVVIGNTGSTVGATIGTVTGDDCDAAAEYAHAHGEDAVAQRMYGHTIANGSFAAPGDRMSTVFELSRYTPDSTYLELTLDGGTPVDGTGPEDSNRIRLEDDKTYMIVAHVAGRGDQSALGSTLGVEWIAHVSCVGGTATIHSSSNRFTSNINYNFASMASGRFIQLYVAAASNEPANTHARVFMTEVEGPPPP